MAHWWVSCPCIFSIGSTATISINCFIEVPTTCRLVLSHVLLRLRLHSVQVLTIASQTSFCSLLLDHSFLACFFLFQLFELAFCHCLWSLMCSFSFNVGSQSYVQLCYKCIQPL
ncbi:hypothetical protein C8J56DRAFT_1421 [Mycena floridula]|nr:hypothetical protein C8J56DRAFT_1421 [Mycena floridula]